VAGALSLPAPAHAGLREIEIAGRLRHPHILPMLESGTVGQHLTVEPQSVTALRSAAPEAALRALAKALAKK
jgi:hypothetical protein